MRYMSKYSECLPSLISLIFLFYHARHQKATSKASTTRPETGALHPRDESRGFRSQVSVRDESLLAQLHPNRIVIPRAVYTELSNPHIAHLKARVDTMLASGQAAIAEIDVGTDEYDVFYKLTQAPEPGIRLLAMEKLRQLR